MEAQVVAVVAEAVEVAVVDVGMGERRKEEMPIHGIRQGLSYFHSTIFDHAYQIDHSACTLVQP
jgi:hypothetical protein